ncbi:heat shock 22 kDa protein, mitochondrial isoform X2 [Medicago truncatula]|uniref:heat shock 22 kDa protein, mitochondrial isoform X2 n=1 Tax=Medicago truncatula TaxID=3880 RepID=UPI001967838B|nr:heat shock 22 kDa protein, mitochondrial isoform X2 [Medicago truncatula]
MRQYDEHSDKSNVADRRHAYCSFACTRHDDFLSDVNMVDQLMDNPFLSASHGIGSGGVRRGWDAKEIEDSLLLRLDMPGLGFMVDVGFYFSLVSLFNINQVMCVSMNRNNQR